MSLLDKISGLAQKAKDNVVSKTFISKDKRLEHSLSEHVKVNEIYFEKVSTFGLPSTINVIAYDYVASLLAVAGDSANGYVKVFGKGISTTIRLPKSVGIKYLQFKTGLPILIVIDKANTIITIDLRTKSIRHALPAPEIITSQTYCTGTDWLFIGYANGFVDVFDIMLGTVTPYQIPDLLENQEIIDPEEISQQHIVVDLQLHPTDLNTLLIGYEAIVFIWNIRESTIRRAYSLRKLEKSSIYRNSNLTCFAWSPNGSRFIAGYDDGSTHLWDVKNEQKPLNSRKISDAFSVPGKEAAVSEPIYQIAWYANTAVHKSYIVIAGGTNAMDIQGLNVLEFDLDSDAREAKKQSIMPLPSDLSHFLILSTDPYYLGMHNPLCIAVIGVDHCLRVFGLEPGFPSLKLPPALEFLGPNILNACHIPQLPASAFSKLAGMTTSDRQTRYLPITGGVAGSEHVYHIDTNDLLVTIHQGEVVKFWDASYTALRPLSHLTIHCLEELADQEALLCSIDVNKNNALLTVGFSDGSILIYEYQPDAQIPTEIDPRLRKRNEEFINSCDDTLKEISELLQDMGSASDAQEEEQEHSDVVPADTNSFSKEQSEGIAISSAETATTNPFLSPSPTHQQPQPQQQQPQEISSEASTPQPPPRKLSKQSSVFKTINKYSEKAGFYALVRISLGSLPIKSTDFYLFSIAAASDDGSVSIIDIYRQLVLFSCNIAQIDFQNTVAASAAQPKSDNATNLEEADRSKPQPTKPASITSIRFFNTYSPTQVMAISTQLYVGLSNGHVYQFNLSTLHKVTAGTLNEYLSLRMIPSGPLIDMYMIDLNGNSQSASTQYVQEGHQQKLAKQPSHHPSNESEDEVSPKPSSIISNSSSTTTSNTSSVNNSNVPSKRMAAIGKGEYRQQEHPHFSICITDNSIQIFLSGYNVKLFAREFAASPKIVRSQVVKSGQQGVCLVLLMDNGRLAFYTLPTLDLILEMALPNTCLLDRLQESSISEDGRVVFWSGKYEMEEFSFIHKPELTFGESVVLFDASRAMPSHPSMVTLQQQQKAKKTWLDTVAGAFQKEPLTMQELDLLMGRIPMEDPNELRRQKIDAYKAKMEKEANSSSSSSKGPGGVFSELGDKMNERGERLNELDKKFQDMNAASGDFLRAVKDYNERQARKKWWEF
ncbi:hypothetical protein [Parasitella parasitica]|uniref:Lethal giant larvae (Lgl)-like C-terminal domain-containing protein n=1 Tax=Parasitella parasitica TaxID=35722 RepID=A0A0B7NAQ1_9FUNG|nr:hypothetical protein [Parasitella parasitica]